MTISMIVAYGKDRAIGAKGKIPWQGKQAADMKFFRDATQGASLVMGRKTYESIGPGGLPGRQNIIVTHHGLSHPDPAVEVVSSLQEAYQRANHPIMIIGGGQIYQAALGDADNIYATEIACLTPHADAFFPLLGPKWIVTAREDHEADEKNIYPYSFITYTKQQ